MNYRRILWVILAAAVAVYALYDVEPVFDIALPAESRVPDPNVEAAYALCYQERDDAIHATAFGTIDNPDVQKEFITSNRQRAKRDCRDLHPEVKITVRKPARFRLFNLEPRFW